MTQPPLDDQTSVETLVKDYQHNNKRPTSLQDPRKTLLHPSKDFTTKNSTKFFSIPRILPYTQSRQQPNTYPTKQTKQIPNKLTHPTLTTPSKTNPKAKQKPLQTGSPKRNPPFPPNDITPEPQPSCRRNRRFGPPEGVELQRHRGLLCDWGHGAASCEVFDPREVRNAKRGRRWRENLVGWLAGWLVGWLVGWFVFVVVFVFCFCFGIDILKDEFYDCLDRVLWCFVVVLVWLVRVH